MEHNSLLNRFETARRDTSLAVLEGFHAIKHAIRFGADIQIVASSNLSEQQRLAGILAPDVKDSLAAITVEVPESVMEKLSPHPSRAESIAIAHRSTTDLSQILDDPRPRPVVFLERTSHLGNIGAVIRVAAGAGAAGVVTTGQHDPWNSVAIRGGAGLQFAIPVMQIERLPECDRPLIAIHPDGDELSADLIPDRAILAFGEERTGLSDSVLQQTETHLRIPMTDGVSSLNLATAAAVVLYTWRLRIQE